MSIERFGSNPRMSAVVKHGGILYLCGVTSGKEGITVQTQDVLDIIEGRLKEHGSSKEHILRATIFIKDMAQFAEMNAVWDAWTDKAYAPARACVQAEMARPDVLVEILVDAAVAE